MQEILTSIFQFLWNLALISEHVLSQHSITRSICFCLSSNLLCPPLLLNSVCMCTNISLFANYLQYFVICCEVFFFFSLEPEILKCVLHSTCNYSLLQHVLKRQGTVMTKLVNSVEHQVCFVLFCKICLFTLCTSAAKEKVRGINENFHEVDSVPLWNLL